MSYQLLKVVPPFPFGDGFTMEVFFTQGNFYRPPDMDEAQWASTNLYGPDDIVMTTWIWDVVHNVPHSRSHALVGNAVSGHVVSSAS